MSRDGSRCNIRRSLLLSLLLRQRLPWQICFISHRPAGDINTPGGNDTARAPPLQQNRISNNRNQQKQNENGDKRPRPTCHGAPPIIFESPLEQPTVSTQRLPLGIPPIGTFHNVYTTRFSPPSQTCNSQKKQDCFSGKNAPVRARRQGEQQSVAGYEPWMEERRNPRQGTNTAHAVLYSHNYFIIKEL